MSAKQFHALAIAIAALCATPAVAEPRLRPSVVITGDIVTAGDLFEDAGTYAGVPLFRAPAPGTIGAVPVADITRAAAFAGIGAVDTTGIGAVRVERGGVAVDLALVTGLIAEELRARGELPGNATLTIQPDAPLPRLYAATGLGAAVSLFDFTTVPSSDRFQARLTVAGRSQPLLLAGRLEPLVDAPFLARTMSGGDIIGPDDIDMRAVPLRRLGAETPLPLDDLVGMAIRRTLREGSLIGDGDITAPLLVGRNEIVTLIYRTGTLRLTARGKALAAAALGEPIAVLNLLSNKVVQGRVAGPGAVAVGPAPALLADAS